MNAPSLPLAAYGKAYDAARLRAAAEHAQGLAGALVARQARQAQGRPLTVAITALTSGAGVTTFAAGLATALHDAFRVRAVLAEANLRHPGVEELLALPRRPGLGQLLTGRIPLVEALQLPNDLRPPVISAGLDERQDAAALLHPRQLETLIAGCAGRFDFVVLDCPPIGATADMLLIGQTVDEVYLVLDAGQSTSDAVISAAEALATVGARIDGLILNRAHP